MVQMRVVMVAVLLCCAAEAARADLIVEPRTPPQEEVLTGTLSWEDVKQSDGTVVDRRLVLSNGDRRDVLPVTSEANVRSTKPNETIDVSSYVGKQVKVTVMVAQRRSMKFVIGLTRIEEQDTTTAEAKAVGPQPPADTKTSEGK